MGKVKVLLLGEKDDVLGRELQDMAILTGKRAKRRRK